MRVVAENVPPSTAASLGAALDHPFARSGLKRRARLEEGAYAVLLDEIVARLLDLLVAGVLAHAQTPPDVALLGAREHYQLIRLWLWLCPPSPMTVCDPESVTTCRKEERAQCYETVSQH